MTNITTTADANTAVDATDNRADWELAGESWDHAAVDWAYRFEPYARDSVEHIFDIVTSFNGNEGGCRGAFDEAYRVLRPGGSIAITFWGPGQAFDLRDFFIVIGTTAPGAAEELIGLAAFGSPEVVKPSLDQVGEDDLRRQVLEAAQPFRADDGSYWMVNELTHVIASKPATAETVR